LIMKESSMYILKRSVKKLLISGLVFSAGSAPLLAQQADTLERNPVVKNAQTIQISGTVTEASTGRPLPGINVTVSGFSAALTDENGNYKINVPHQAGVILFSGSGYQLKEAALKGRTTINIALYEDTFSSVYDKAALPHGTMLKNRIPYSVVSVSTNGAWNRPMETPDSYLQGKAAGLDVIRRSGTSDIGADM